MKTYREFTSDDQRTWEFTRRAERRRNWAMIACAFFGMILGNLAGKILIRFFMH